MPYILDGQPISVSQEPQNKEGTLWVPLRSLAEAVGARVDWDPDSRVVNVYQGDKIIHVTPGDTVVSYGGEQTELRAAPYLADGDTWVPVRFFNQPLGYALNVDIAANQVELTTWNG